MPQGLQVWDASGNSVMDTTTNTGKILGRVSVSGSANGSVTDVKLSSGTPFWVLIPVTYGKVAVPEVSISGNTISWVTSYATSASSYYLIYGVY